MSSDERLARVNAILLSIAEALLLVVPHFLQSMCFLINAFRLQSARYIYIYPFWAGMFSLCESTLLANRLYSVARNTYKPKII